MRKKKNNKEIKGFNLENKIELQKSTCSVCDKKNQLLLKRVKNKKNGFHRIIKEWCIVQSVKAYQ